MKYDFGLETGLYKFVSYKYPELSSYFIITNQSTKTPQFSNILFVCFM